MGFWTPADLPRWRRVTLSVVRHLERQPGAASLLADWSAQNAAELEALSDEELFGRWMRQFRHPQAVEVLMHRRVLATCLAGVLSVCACEHRQGALVTSPDAEPLRLAAPDPAFELTAEDRAALAPGFDADALERLLRHTRNDMRGEILSYFQVGNARGHLVEIHDPDLQAILEEVWVPFWDNAPDEALDGDWYRMPGREIARARRAAERARRQQPPQQR